MQILAISLPHASDRRAQLERQLGPAGLHYRVLDALDGDRGLKEGFNGIDHDAFLLRTGRRARPGEIGCYASHLLAWQECVASGETTCVLEDDCQLTEQFPETLALAGQLCAGLGYVRLQTETRGKSRIIARIGEFQVHRYTRMPHSALCYLLTPAVAATLIAHSRIMTAPVDVFIKRFWEHGVPLYGLSPYPASESPLSDDSMIEKRNKAAKPMLLSLQRWVLRRIVWPVRRRRFNATPGHDAEGRRLAAQLATQISAPKEAA